MHILLVIAILVAVLAKSSLFSRKQKKEEIKILNEIINLNDQ